MSDETKAEQEGANEALSAADAFPGRLAAARKKRALSQQDLARKSGLPPSSISHFEAAKRLPSFDNLSRLADALSVTADFLIGRSEETSTATVTDSIRANLDKLGDYQLGLADRFIEMLATEKPKSPSDE
jgi:transcriptional regulator with XRE-family HTH domain